jgi:hypothetical protein
VQRFGAVLAERLRLVLLFLLVGPSSRLDVAAGRLAYHLRRVASIFLQRQGPLPMPHGECLSSFDHYDTSFNFISISSFFYQQKKHPGWTSKKGLVAFWFRMRRQGEETVSEVLFKPYGQQCSRCSQQTLCEEVISRSIWILLAFLSSDVLI